MSKLALAHGSFFVITGIWPILSLSTFEAVTGEKTDDWLVHSVGLLLTVIGAVLVRAGVRKRVRSDVVLLAIGAACAMAAIDIVYAARGVISPIYYADAGIEILFVVGWIFAFRSRLRSFRS